MDNDLSEFAAARGASALAAVIRDVGRSVVRSSHDLYVRHTMDDSEYAANVKAVIEGVSRIAEERLGKKFADEVRRDLKDIARFHYIEGWMEMAFLDGDPVDEVSERAKAHSTFEKVFRSAK